MIFPKIIVNFEKWRFNKEYGVYVSNQGKFKDRQKRIIPIKISKGYCVVKTEVGHVLAHRLVMKTWCPAPNSEELTVDHLNHNKRDNRVENLEWVTFEENLRRANRDLLHLTDEELDDYITGKTKKVVEDIIRETSFGKKISLNGVQMTLSEAITFCHNCNFGKSLDVSSIKDGIEKALKGKNKGTYMGFKFENI